MLSIADCSPVTPDPSLEQQAVNQHAVQAALDQIMGSEPWIEEFSDGTVKAIHFSNFAAFSPKQLDFLANSGPDDCKYAILDGSVRAGKTMVTLFKWFFICADPPTNDPLLMAAFSGPNVFDNMVIPMQDASVFGPLARFVVGKKGANEITIFGRQVLVRGSGDIASAKRIRGITLAGAILDEATLAHESFFEELLVRLGFVEDAQLFMTTNPGAPTHWLKVNYLDQKGKKERWGRWKFLLRDNPKLSPRSLRDIMGAVAPGPEYERKINGKWAGSEGAIYSIWDPEKHIVKWEDIPPMRFIWVSIDYGITNATSAIVQGLGVDGCIYDINEYRYDIAEGLMDLHEAILVDEIVAWMKRPGFLPPQVDQAMRPRWIIVDSAARGVKNRLRQFHKYRNVAKRTYKFVDSGLQTCIGLMHEDLNFVSERCTGLIKEMTDYVWDKAASRASGRDIVKKANDHSQDAHRYGIMTTLPITQKYLKHKPLMLPEKQFSAADLETL